MLSDIDCKEVTEMEKVAFVVCGSDGAEGLTWAEVADFEVRVLCLSFDIIQVKYADSGVPLSTQADFTMFDLNSDGTLFIEEWKEKSHF